MARNSERFEELKYQDAAWETSPGVSETPSFWETPPGVSETPSFSGSSDPEPHVDQITRDVLSIFDEGQAKANGPKLRFDLLDVGWHPISPDSPRDVEEDDYSADSRP